MDILFFSNADIRFDKAIEEYSTIWSSEEKDIIRAIEKISEIRFLHSSLRAEIIDGKSQSHPLRLRFDYDSDDKKETLVHELCHILLKENDLKADSYRGNLSLGIHMILDLILFDILTDIWGEEFAKKAVDKESLRSTVYKEAWKWALSFNKEERKRRFTIFKNNTSKGS